MSPRSPIYPRRALLGQMILQTLRSFCRVCAYEKLYRENRIYGKPIGTVGRAILTEHRINDEMHVAVLNELRAALFPHTPKLQIHTWCSADTLHALGGGGRR